MSKRMTIDHQAVGWPLATELYHRLLDLFYTIESKPRAVPIAFRLLRILDKLDPNSETLLALASRAVSAEVDGDFEEAIHYRERELAVMDRLIASGQYESAGFDHADYRDRLDLIANLTLDLDRLDEATKTIERSATFCKMHRLKFDGRDIQNAILHARKATPTAA